MDLKFKKLRASKSLLLTLMCVLVGVFTSGCPDDKAETDYYAETRKQILEVVPDLDYVKVHESSNDYKVAYNSLSTELSMNSYLKNTFLAEAEEGFTVFGLKVRNTSQEDLTNLVLVVHVEDRDQIAFTRISDFIYIKDNYVVEGAPKLTPDEFVYPEQIYSGHLAFIPAGNIKAGTEYKFEAMLLGGPKLRIRIEAVAEMKEEGVWAVTNREMGTTIQLRPIGTNYLEVRTDGVFEGSLATSRLTAF